MLDGAVRDSVGPGGTQGPRKLRDSCTDCASSKVRCSKEKPTCARCARRGVACIYMVSRRTGRTSSNASKMDATQIWIGTSRLGIGRPGSVRVPAGRGQPSSTGFAGGTRGSSATRDRLTGRKRSLHTGFPLESRINTHPHTGQVTAAPGLGISQEIDMWNYISPTTLLADAAGSPPTTGPGNDVGAIFGLGLTSHMIMDRQESSSPETNDQSIVSTPDIFGNLPLSVLDTDFSATHSFALNWNSPTDSNTRRNSNPDPPGCCLTTILDLLARLFPSAANDCTRSAASTLLNNFHHDSQTIESVITENRHRIETLTGLLECQCSHDEYLLSLVALATLKVMGWYAAAAAATETITKEDDGNSSIPPTPSPSTSPPALYAQSNFHPKPHPQSEAQSHDHSQTLLLPTPTSPNPTTAPSYNQHPPALGEHVLLVPSDSAPTSISAYCLAGVPSPPVGPRLVLAELHRAGRLAQALAQRLEGVRLRVGAGLSGGLSGEGGAEEYGLGSGNGGRGGGGGGAGREPPLSVSTLFQLEEDLRRRMRVLAREVVGGLGAV